MRFLDFVTVESYNLRMMSRVLMAIVLVAAFAGPGLAQSLAEWPRQKPPGARASRRRSKVYTNDDLNSDFTKPASAPASTPATAGTPAEGTAAAKPAASGQAANGPANSPAAAPARDRGKPTGPRAWARHVRSCSAARHSRRRSRTASTCFRRLRQPRQSGAAAGDRAGAQHRAGRARQAEEGNRREHEGRLRRRGRGTPRGRAGRLAAVAVDGTRSRRRANPPGRGQGLTPYDASPRPGGTGLRRGRGQGRNRSSRGAAPIAARGRAVRSAAARSETDSACCAPRRDSRSQISRSWS